MRNAVQLGAFVLALAAIFLVKVTRGAAPGTRMFGLGLAALMVIVGAGALVLARKHAKIVEAGAKRGEAVMPLGRMIASFGALGAIWLYNVAVLALLIVLTIRLV